MKICLGSDHRGYKLKEIIKVYLQEKGYEIIDVGTKNFDRVDFPDYCFSLCQKVVNKDAEIGILFCGTGIGMTIAANKVKGIYCARITNVKEAKLAKEHNDANVIVLVIIGLDAVNINSIFKKNRVFQARLFYLLLITSLVYLVTNFIFDFTSI